MKVLLIDDHELFRDGMRYVLTKLDDNTQVFESCSYEEALPIIQNHQDFDLILLDLGLPGISDIDALKAIRNESPSSPVVILSSNNDGKKVQEILALGAQGYIPKSTNTKVLLNSLKLVLAGGIYIPPEILSQIEVNVVDQKTENNEETSSPLTPRQHDVLEKLTHGLSNKEISTNLSMAEPTVRVHVAAIFKAFDVTNRTSAVHLALQKGWVIIK